MDPIQAYLETLKQGGKQNHQNLTLMSMIALIEPAMIAVIEPRESGPKAISDGFSN